MINQTKLETEISDEEGNLSGERRWRGWTACACCIIRHSRSWPAQQRSSIARRVHDGRGQPNAPASVSPRRIICRWSATYAGRFVSLACFCAHRPCLNTFTYLRVYTNSTSPWSPSSLLGPRRLLSLFCFKLLLCLCGCLNSELWWLSTPLISCSNNYSATLHNTALQFSRPHMNIRCTGKWGNNCCRNLQLMSTFGLYDVT